jgi:hypothetical protein
MRILLPLLMLPLLLLACKPEQHHHITKSFYYWKTVYDLNPFEQQRLREAGCQRMYIRCFDINTDPNTHQPAPVGIIRLPDSLSADMQYVPVVFITQYTLTQLSPAAIKPLAANINKLLTDKCRNMHSDEVQIDCDWTTNTRNTYFALLKALRTESFFKDKQLSCTIRLHQIKYRLASGIPPVDRGLLMCYNMGNLKKAGNHNSILDQPLAEDYLSDVSSYKLPLDVALPLFSWCVQFRNGRLVGILRDIQPEVIAASSLFTKTKDNLYTSTRDTLWQGYTFQAGDEIRTEITTDAAIQTMAAYTARHVNTDSMRVILFHADSITLSKHSTNAIEAIYGAYR